MRPLGFYQGRTSVNTIRLGMEEGGFVYCADFPTPTICLTGSRDRAARSS